MLNFPDQPTTFLDSQEQRFDPDTQYERVDLGCSLGLDSPVRRPIDSPPLPLEQIPPSTSSFNPDESQMSLDLYTEPQVSSSILPANESLNPEDNQMSFEGHTEPQVSSLTVLDNESLNIVNPEDNQMSFELHTEPQAASITLPANESVNLEATQMSIGEAVLSNISTNIFDFESFIDSSADIFSECWEEDGLSVTDDLEYDRFWDARDYFTSQDDPLPQSSLEDGAFLPSSCTSEHSPGTSSNQENITEDQPSGDPPIYKGSKVTLSELAIAFLTLMLTNDISGELLGRFLAFIQLILPECSKFFSSMYSFLQHFKELKAPCNFIYYCSSCFRALDNKNSVCPRCVKGKVSYYLHLPVIPQIKALYSNPNFVEALSYRFNRKKIVENNLEDIYDGELYKSASDILSSQYNISLSWNTDGLSIFNSSNFQIWPFYFTVNELPPHLRFKDEYMILGGLAFGYEKPVSNLFLKPICRETEILANGINVQLPNESPVNVKCIVLCHC